MTPEDAAPDGSPAFRFFDNREKYLLFVTTCGEKWAIAERVGEEFPHLAPGPPALRLFDAGMGDGTVLSSVLRHLHEDFPTTPFLVVGKEISVEDLRLTLEKLPDRLAEHPRTVVAVTNMNYSEAPWLRPGTPEKAAALTWQEVPLEGSSAQDFDRRIEALTPTIADLWQVRSSEKTGNPLYLKPSVLVLYRADQRFLLDSVLPRQGAAEGLYDLVIAAQPYRTRQPAETKVRYVLEPLAKALAPGGRLIAIQSTGLDPGMEIIRKVWPDEEPFRTPAPLLQRVLKDRLAAELPDRGFAVQEESALFRYSLYSGPAEPAAEAELAGGAHAVGGSTLMAAWNAAVYVAQMDDREVAAAMTDGSYLEATRGVLERHGGLWFIDESFVVSRRG